jgi:hypothetical protein
MKSPVKGYVVWFPYNVAHLAGLAGADMLRAGAVLIVWNINDNAF